VLAIIAMLSIPLVLLIRQPRRPALSAEPMPVEVHG
jgi:hypothetical protein